MSAVDGPVSGWPIHRVDVSDDINPCYNVTVAGTTSEGRECYIEL
jgi:hypothetical protein